MEEIKERRVAVKRTISQIAQAKREAHFFLNHTDLSTFEIEDELGMTQEEIERNI